MLLKFLEERDLTKADFHRTLQKKFGEKTPGYFTMNSWIVGTRRPSEVGQAILEEACGIPRTAWLTEKDLSREKWKQELAQREPAQAEKAAG